MSNVRHIGFARAVTIKPISMGAAGMQGGAILGSWGSCRSHGKSASLAVWTVWSGRGKMIESQIHASTTGRVCGTERCAG